MQAADFHGTWSSRLAFLLAAVGAAVGLGNMWKFPYTAGVSGGGAFVLIYLIAVIVVAVPIGVLADVHRRLVDASIDVYAANGVTDANGRFGYLIYVRPDDYDRAAGILEC